MKILTMMTLDVFRLSLGWALESCGHEVYHVNTSNEGKLEEAIRIFQPDLFLDMGWDSEHCYPERMQVLQRVLKKHNLFHVYFAEEDALHYDYWSVKYVNQVAPDYVWTRGYSCVDKYHALGIPATFLDVGCNREFHRPVEPLQELICDISVLCNGQFNWDIYRRKSVEHLIIPLFQMDCSVQIWGRDWEQTMQYYGVTPREGMHRGLLPFHLSPRAYSSAKINMSVQSVEDQISNRTFEIMASGGFMITSNTARVQEILQPGVCCVTSSSPQETKQLIAYYLANETQRFQIAQNGLHLARTTFAYQVTLPPILKKTETFLQQWTSGVKYA